MWHQTNCCYRYCYRDVVCRYRGANYKATLLCFHNNCELLTSLVEDINRRVMSVCIERYYAPRGLLRRRLFVDNNNEDDLPDKTKDTSEDSFKPLEEVMWPKDSIDQYYERLGIISSKYSDEDLVKLADETLEGVCLNTNDHEGSQLLFEKSVIGEENETREINPSADLSIDQCRGLLNDEDLLYPADTTLQGIFLNANDHEGPQLLPEKSMNILDNEIREINLSADLSVDRYCGSLNDDDLLKLADTTLQGIFSNTNIPQLSFEKSLSGQVETKKIEVLQNICLNKSTCRQRWTTPQKHKLREYFGERFKAYKTGRNSVRTYPNTYELQKAIDTLPEFKRKSAATLRSKIQHEYRKIEQGWERAKKK